MEKMNFIIIMFIHQVSKKLLWYPFLLCFFFKSKKSASSVNEWIHNVNRSAVNKCTKEESTYQRFLKRNYHPPPKVLTNEEAKAVVASKLIFLFIISNQKQKSLLFIYYLFHIIYFHIQDFSNYDKCTNLFRKKESSVRVNYERNSYIKFI